MQREDERRQAANRWEYPPTCREGIDAIAVIIDTSGSVPAGILERFPVEIREIATTTGPERGVVLQVDAAVQDDAEYAAGDLPGETTIRGRGRIDFRPGFAWPDEHDVRPSA